MAHPDKKMDPSSKSEKNLKDAPLPPLPFAKQSKKDEGTGRNKELERIMNKEGPFTVEEASKILEDLEDKKQKLKSKLDEMYRIRGVTPEYLKTYLNNPSNFSVKQWKNLQEKRQEFMESLNLPPELMKEKSSFDPTKSSDTSKVSANTKDRRGKAGSAYRRGWIPMH